jgi:hypothetical protein
MIYEEIKLGVFIQGVSGKLYETDAWANQETPNGIAILTDNCRFVVAKQNCGRTLWGGYGTDIPTLTNYEYEDGAITDFDGVNNTSKIIAAIGNSNDGYRDGTAAGDCAAYTFPNGKPGYLGAAGEWQVARQNKEDLNSALTLIDGTKMAEDYYWTSTECDSDSAWRQLFDSNNNVDTNYKGFGYHYNIRAFLSC